MILDLTSLRTLVAAVDLDGFGKAAEVLHLSPSTVSLQLRALEERLGKPLFRKIGRRQGLTGEGEMLVSFARRMLELNDEAVLAVRGTGLHGKICLGVPQDFADSWLPQTLALFTSAHPKVQLEILVEQSGRLLQLLRDGALDLALTFGDNGGMGSQLITTLPVHWYAHATWQLPEREALPLLVLEQPCMFRQRAIDALDRAGTNWRIALSGSSVSAVWAAAKAGLGLVARTAIHVPDEIACLDGAFGLPDLNAVPLHLVRSSHRGDAAIDHLSALLLNIINSHMDSVGPETLGNASA
ncbi:LysR substrate-binding domain-containing protein [Dyella sp. GSA-30]|uniref:LysR substrate-binding domain-containing protein n=1 Tax=Dyella sp. GSA-30 TaxID=2994496 RepID=UPI002491C654|nr:LysR substrate-binding domain-containing protein [Dyella sp. GSA-30]BDU21566.1 LysR family transcriptional regulator [Dyella sp. GSA-30]